MIGGNLDLPEQVLNKIDSLGVAGASSLLLPDELAQYMPVALAELMYTSIQWPKVHGRPATAHLYEGFNVEVSLPDEFYPGDPRGGAQPPRHGRDPMPVSIWDSALPDDQTFRVNIVSHLRSGSHTYLVEVTLLPAISWTPDPEPHGLKRTIDPPYRTVDFPDQQRLPPFTVSFGIPPVRLPRPL